MKDRCTRARAATEEMVISVGLGAHLGEGLADPLAAVVHVAAAGFGQRLAGGHGRVIRWWRAGWRACRA